MKVEDEIKAIVRWEIDAWDSDRFGVQMGRLEVTANPELEAVNLGKLIAAAIEQCEAQGIAYLFVRVPAAALPVQRVLEDLTFRSLGTLIKFALQPAHVSPAPEQVPVRAGLPSDVSNLRRIAGSAFRTSRFHQEPMLKMKQADSLWEDSVEEAVRGRADLVLVAVLEDVVVGFLTLRKRGEALSLWKTIVYGIDIIAVDPAYRRRGVAQSMLSSAVEYTRSRSSWLEVGTQVYNLPATQLYEEFGFRMVETLASFSCWNPPQMDTRSALPM